MGHTESCLFTTLTHTTAACHRGINRATGEAEGGDDAAEERTPCLLRRAKNTTLDDTIWCLFRPVGVARCGGPRTMLIAAARWPARGIYGSR